jgi:hypothetical protein
MPVERKWQHALCRTPQTESARVMHRYSAEAVQPEIDKDKPREPSSDVSASGTLVDWGQRVRRNGHQRGQLHAQLSSALTLADGQGKLLHSPAEMISDELPLRQIAAPHVTPSPLH